MRCQNLHRQVFAWQCVSIEQNMPFFFSFLPCGRRDIRFTPGQNIKILRDWLDSRCLSEPRVFAHGCLSLIFTGAPCLSVLRNWQSRSHHVRQQLGQINIVVSRRREEEGKKKTSVPSDPTFSSTLVIFNWHLLLTFENVPHPSLPVIPTTRSARAPELGMEMSVCKCSGTPGRLIWVGCGYKNHGKRARDGVTSYTLHF